MTKFTLPPMSPTPPPPILLLLLPLTVVDSSNVQFAHIGVKIVEILKHIIKTSTISAVGTQSALSVLLLRKKNVTIFLIPILPEAEEHPGAAADNFNCDHTTCFGGGSGHEPSHAGFVGERMLTAAICGNVFASPNADSILAGIRAVIGPKGCLLIVKNYTSDCQKFGLAAEEAKAEVYKVEAVIVVDDYALPPPAGRRCLAGTILVYKVAGAGAEAGLALSDVAAEAKHASEMVGTMGAVLSGCTILGHDTFERIRPGQMELGLGIMSRRPEQLNSEGYILEAAVQAAANAIIDLRDNLNECSGKLGDGNFGTTMFRGAPAILEDIKKHYPLNDAAEIVNEIGCSIRKAMDGTSGVVYGLFFTAAYMELKADSNSAVTPAKWADALQAAVAAISKYGGVATGYHTLLDALNPALLVLKEHLDAGVNPVDAFVLSSEAAMAGAESTKHMLSQSGHSIYMSLDVLTSVPDPGAMAAAVWFRAAALAVKGISTKE